MTAKYTEPTFRVYEPKRVYCPQVEAYVWMQVCEELVDGLWEGFVSWHKSRPVF